MQLDQPFHINNNYEVDDDNISARAKRYRGQRRTKQELSYRKHIARQLRIQNV